MQNCLSIIITSLRDFGYSTRLHRITECWSCGMWVSPHTALVFFTFKLPATSQSNPGRSEGRAEHRQGGIKMRERFVPIFLITEMKQILCAHHEKILSYPNLIADLYYTTSGTEEIHSKKYIVVLLTKSCEGF